MDIKIFRLCGQIVFKGLIQDVTGVTHTRCHTLDVVITRDVSSIVHGKSSIVDPCLYNINGNRSVDHLGIYLKVDLISRSI